jgi:repressor LexA
MKNLTQKQEQIFLFIKDTIHDSGFPPTVREIGEKFSITVKGAYDHLKAIEKKGYIRCTQNKSRAIEVLLDKNTKPPSDVLKIPLLGRIAAGSPILAQENIEDYIKLPKSMLPGGDLFALHVKGDSMIEKGIADGDIAIIKKQNTANNGDIVAALIDDEATLKIFKTIDRKVHLIPANPSYKPIVPENVTVLGKLVSLIRQY